MPNKGKNMCTNNLCADFDFDDVSSLEIMVCEDIKRQMSGREFASNQARIEQYWKEYFAE
jgi:hypothetical protein